MRNLTAFDAEALKTAVTFVLVLMFLFVVSEAYKYHRPSPKLRPRFW